MDFRLPENRRELFIRWYVSQYRMRDLDTPIFLMNYMFKRLEYNLEQRYWFAFLYGTNYQMATSYAIFNEIPDYENIDSDMLTKFNNDKYPILPYQTDTKWNRGHLDKQIESYREVVGKYQYKFFEDICSSNDPRENYDNLKKVIVDKFYKFGRYCTFFYMQTLKHCCGLNIEPTSMQYGYETQSPTDGLCLVLNKEEWMSRYYTENGTKKNKRSVKYTPEILEFFDKETDSIMDEIRTRFPDIIVDYFFVETALCSIKKLWRKRDGRYLGYYIDRLWSDTQKTAAGFTGVDWDIVSDFINEETPASPELPDRAKMDVFLDTGDLPELSMYKDLENK